MIAPKIALFFICLLFLFALSAARAADRKALFRDNFDTLENWRPIYFPRVAKHTLYSIDRQSGSGYLKAQSHASASALVWKGEFDVREYPNLRWRWKVENLYKTANPHVKGGDDYPIRIYVMFKFDPAKASFFEKLRYGIARIIYGEYPPESTINYVWASREEKEKIYPSPYTKRAMIIVLEAGGAKVGQWATEEVSIPQDYRKAFGKEPPPTASIAIMNDSDDTGESSISYLDFIEIFKRG
jgi:hypothetical protein